MRKGQLDILRLVPPAPPVDASEDRDLARALIARDPRAPRALWRRYAPMVSRILKRMLGRDHDVEDLAQDVFLCVFEKVPTLRDPKALKAFVVSITLLTARSELRRLWIQRCWTQLAREQDAASMAVAALDTGAREVLKRFYGVLDRINTRDRALFVLRFMEELELPDIAAASGLSLATTKRHLTRAWSKVRLLTERDPVISEYLASRKLLPIRSRPIMASATRHTPPTTTSASPAD